jgi:hypothetical protein
MIRVNGTSETPPLGYRGAFWALVRKQGGEGRATPIRRSVATLAQARTNRIGRRLLVEKPVPGAQP